MPLCVLPRVCQPCPPTFTALLLPFFRFRSRLPPCTRALHLSPCCRLGCSAFRTADAHGYFCSSAASPPSALAAHAAAWPGHAEYLSHAPAPSELSPRTHSDPVHFVIHGYLGRPQGGRCRSHQHFARAPHLRECMPRADSNPRLLRSAPPPDERVRAPPCLLCAFVPLRRTLCLLCNPTFSRLKVILQLSPTDEPLHYAPLRDNHTFTTLSSAHAP